MNRILLSLIATLAASPALAAVGSCPISADFIATPETVEAVVPLGSAQVESTTQRSFVDGAVVSIECLEAAAEVVFPGESDESILRRYIQFWSIEPLEDSISQGSVPFSNAIISGTKVIQGVEVVYSYRLFRFPESFAMVAVGSPVESQNSADVQRFLSSLDIQSPDIDFTDQEKMEGRKNHMAACLPAVHADNERRELGLTELEITFFCSCTGARYFDEFSRAELQALAVGSDDKLEAQREQIQTECFVEAAQ